MAAPVATARVAPTGIRLRNGFKSTITFSQDTNIEMWEMEVGQPGMDGGDPVDTTTMHSVEWREKAPRTLKDLTPFTVKFAYDPVIWNSSSTSTRGAINREDTITITYPDLSTLAFFGYLQKVEFEPLVEGTMPAGTATIVPTNWDYTNKTQAGPVETDIAGT